MLWSSFATGSIHKLNLKPSILSIDHILDTSRVESVGFGFEEKSDFVHAGAFVALVESGALIL